MIYHCTSCKLLKLMTMLNCHFVLVCNFIFSVVCIVIHVALNTLQFASSNSTKPKRVDKTDCKLSLASISISCRLCFQPVGECERVAVRAHSHGDAARNAAYSRLQHAVQRDLSRLHRRSDRVRFDPQPDDTQVHRRRPDSQEGAPRSAQGKDPVSGEKKGRRGG